MNILNHINNQLNSNFNILNFEHKAIYNEEKNQIEMHLISKNKQKVKIENETISFDEKESILTEISTKYDLVEFKKLISDFFEIKKIWTDKYNMFSVLFLKAK